MVKILISVSADGKTKVFDKIFPFFTFCFKRCRIGLRNLTLSRDIIKNKNVHWLECAVSARYISLGKIAPVSKYSRGKACVPILFTARTSVTADHCKRVFTLIKKKISAKTESSKETCYPIVPQIQ